MKNEATKTLPVICCSLIVAAMMAAICLYDVPANASEITQGTEESTLLVVSDRVYEHENEADQSDSVEVEAVEDTAEESYESESVSEQFETEEAYEYELSDLCYDYGNTYYDYSEPVYDYTPTDGLTPAGGVNYYDGRTETYYSSNILYHYQTPEWTLDDEGFYHDAEGRYVVAASDMEQGTTFEGSKGECIVLDTGCAPGVTDYYVNWLGDEQV